MTAIGRAVTFALEVALTPATTVWSLAVERFAPDPYAGVPCTVARRRSA